MRSGPLGWLVPVAFILIWAVGYLVAKAAAQYADPLTFLSLRYALVVALMGGLALVARAPWPKGRDALWLALTGLGIHGIYLGCTWNAIALGLPTGIAALIVNLQPVLLALLGPWTGDRITRRQWSGVWLGLVGVGLVVAPKLLDQQVALAHSALPLLLVTCALLGITAGTALQKRQVPHFDLRSGQAIQMAASCVCTLPLAWALEPMRLEWNPSSIGAMVLAVGVLSGLGISLMFWMLRHGQATAVTSLMYVVPSITAVMGYVWFGETLSPWALLGMAVTLVGVYRVVGPGGHRTPRLADPG